MQLKMLQKVKVCGCESCSFDSVFAFDVFFHFYFCLLIFIDFPFSVIICALMKGKEMSVCYATLRRHGVCGNAWTSGSETEISRGLISR
jgi:hypothetical protein